MRFTSTASSAADQLQLCAACLLARQPQKQQICCCCRPSIEQWGAACCIAIASTFLKRMIGEERAHATRKALQVPARPPLACDLHVPSLGVKTSERIAHERAAAERKAALVQDDNNE